MKRHDGRRERSLFRILQLLFLRKKFFRDLLKQVSETLSARSLAPQVTIGSYNEGQEMRLVCESGGGKPIPRVTWYNGRGEVIAGT